VNRQGHASPRWRGFEAGLRWAIERSGLRASDVAAEDWRERGITVKAADEPGKADSDRAATWKDQCGVGADALL
jgi:hypothetical protein